MDLQDVMQGKIPFSNPKKFREMNMMVCSLARKLGDKGPVSGKANKMRFSGEDSVKDVLSDMIEIVNKENVDPYTERFFPRSLKPQWLEDLANDGGEYWSNIADAFWNFFSECYAGLMVRISATYIFARICQLNDRCDLKTITLSQKNFMVASLVLFNLSDWRTVIIHTPLGHDCGFTCEKEMLCYIASNNGPPDLPRFNQTLGNNAMWRCYDHIGNYNLLKKLLVIIASGKGCVWLGVKQKSALFAVKRLLECGAQPGPAYAVLFDYKKVTALHAAVRNISGEDLKIEVAKSLFNDCDREQQEQLANASDEDGCTALHDACYLGLANTCQILLDYGARLDVPEKNGKTALHIAVEVGNDAIVNIFMKHQQITANVVDLQDKWGESPLDTALAHTNMELVAKLISKSKQPEAYFDKVDLKQLLRYYLLEGSVEIVRKLLEKGTELPAGECDDEGKTVLHLAAMCEDDNKAMEMVDMVVRNIERKEILVANRDRKGRTVLHEAALNGNEKLCRYLLDLNPKIINLKDWDGRKPIYEAAKGKQNEKGIILMLLAEYSKKGIPVNALIDRNGLTPLHVAASLGKKDVIKLLLSTERQGREYLKRRDLVAQEALEYLKRSDFLGQTALHKAANCGDPDTVQILLNEGAHPLQERDCDGRTALHYAVKAKTGGDKRILIELLLEGCKTNEEKWLLLWASAAGLGTADNSLSSDNPLHKFLVDKKEEIKAHLTTGNLLKTASSVGDIEMTKELIARGYQIEDLCDTEWRKGLTPEETKNFERVLRQLGRIAEQGNDQLTVPDTFGRIDLACGLAALFLNPYIKPPIVVGIYGPWGMGKSSLMVQTEGILLKTAAQMALLPSAKLASSAKLKSALIKKYTNSNINRSFKDNQELAHRYLQKVIQLPLYLPEPSEEQSTMFLEGQLGVFHAPSEGGDSELKRDGGMAEILRQETFMPEVGRSRESTFDITEIETVLPATSPSVCCGRKDETEATTSDAAATLSVQTGGEARREGEVPIAKHTVNRISNRNHWPWIPIRELLFIRYSKGEQDAFCYFQKLATDTRKLPREWKRHLTYHRLVWYIFYLTGEAKDLAGWQVQLITWIFVCWEWQENLNCIIQNWNKVGALKSIESNGPSLQMIVDHFIELENQKHMEGSRASPEKVETKEAIPEARDTNNRNNETESSKTEQKKSEKPSKEIMPGVDAGPSEKTLREELDELKKEIRDEVKKEITDLKDIMPRVDAGPLDETLRKEMDELKKEIKDLKDNMPRVDAGPLEETLRKEMDGLKKEIKDDLKKEIKDLKDQVMKQHSKKNEKREKEKKMKLKRWQRLRSALQKYDIPMDGILAFQRFRFYCKVRHLSWPLPEQENNEH